MNSDQFAKRGEARIDIQKILEHFTGAIGRRGKLLRDCGQKNETKKEAGVKEKCAPLQFDFRRGMTKEEHPQPIEKKIFVIIGGLPVLDNDYRSGQREPEPEEWLMKNLWLEQAQEQAPAAGHF